MSVQAVFFDMGGTIETFRFTREIRLKATLAIQRLLQQTGIELQLSNQELYEIISSGLDRYKSWSLRTMDELSSSGYGLSTFSRG